MHTAFRLAFISPIDSLDVLEVAGTQQSVVAIVG